MKNAVQPAERFVNRLYRRLLIVRAVEQLGVGLLVASILASVLLGFAVTQSISPGPIVLFFGVFSITLGTFLAIRRCPTRRSAAVEADRQLHLDDLLTTAVFSADHTDAEFLNVVIGMANARCGMFTPSDVLSRRLGIRSWGAIALTLSTVAILSAIPFQPTRSQAVNSLDENVSVLSAPEVAGPLAHYGGEFLPVFNKSMTEESSRKSSMTQAAADQTKVGSSFSGSASEHTNSSGIGGGNASTDTAAKQNAITENHDGRPTNVGGAAAGGGATTGRQKEQGESSGGIAGGSSKSSASAKSVIEQSDHSVDVSVSVHDAIPAEDRDLVHDFFQR